MSGFFVSWLLSLVIGVSSRVVEAASLGLTTASSRTKSGSLIVSGTYRNSNFELRHTTVMPPASYFYPGDDVTPSTGRLVQSEPSTTSSSSSGSPYLVVLIGGSLLGVAVAVILVDYCQHLRRSGIFDRRHDKEAAAMFRRQAMMTIAEIPNNVEMIGPILIQEMAYQRQDYSKTPAIDNDDTEQLIVRTPNESRRHRDRDGDRNRSLKSSPSSLSRSSQRVNLNSENRPVLRQQASLNSQNYLNTASARRGNYRRAVETSKSNSQMAILIKNYGTFDSEVELQFFNETIPAMDAVTKYLPSKMMSLTLDNVADDMDDEMMTMSASHGSASTRLSSTTIDATTVNHRDSRTDEAVKQRLSHCSNTNNSNSNSNSHYTKRQSTVTTASHGHSSRLTTRQPSENVEEIKENVNHNKIESASSIFLPKRRPNGLAAIRPASDNALELMSIEHDGDDDDDSSTLSLLKFATYSQTYLSPPKFLALCQKSNSDTSCFVDVGTSFTSSNLSNDGDDDDDDDSKCASVASIASADGLVMKPCSANGDIASSSGLGGNSFRAKNKLAAAASRPMRKVSSPMYATLSEKMTARMAQLFPNQIASPEQRTFSVSDVFESRQRCIEAQRRKIKAEMLRRRKRRLNGGGSISPVYVRNGGRRTRGILLSTMRVPLRK